MGTHLGSFRKLKIDKPVIHVDPQSEFVCPFAGPVRWQAKTVMSPGAISHDGKVFLLYRAEDLVGRHGGTSRIGIAWSDDGQNFTQHPTPVLYPNSDDFAGLEWEGGCEDPRVVQAADGTFVMTYTAYDGRTARLCIATSTDLFHWRKHGRAFRAEHHDLWCKSGAIVTEVVNGRQVARPIHGLYWMLWGESSIFSAVSPDLVHWTVVYHTTEVANDQRDLSTGHAVIATSRRNRCDSSLVEPGPPPVWTPEGIVAIYGGRNSSTHGCSQTPHGSYAAYQLVLDPQDPSAVIHRDLGPFIAPESTYEVTIRSPHAVFPHGLVYFKGEWLLYYSSIEDSVAIATTRPPTE